MIKKLNIDIWRFILTFLIVAIHISPFDKINSHFDFFFTRILGRIAVPLFLMITGYYIIDKSLQDKNTLKNYTKKILKIYLFCIILYFPINIYMGKLNSINIITIIKDIFINGTLYHLWYFPALILGLWLTYYLLKKLGTKKTLLIVIILYLIGLLGDSYYGLIENITFLRYIYNLIFKIFDYTRNGIFFVPIFISLGYIIKTNNRSNIKYLIFSLISFILMTIEGFILHHYNLQRHDSMYIFLIPLMYFLFSYLISISTSSNKKLRSIATNIYIFHPLFIVIIRFISRILGIRKITVENNLCLYLLVIITTTIFAFFVEKIKEIIKIKKENNLLNNDKDIIDVGSENLESNENNQSE